MTSKDHVKIFALDNSLTIGNKIAKTLGVRLGKTNKIIFKDGECLVMPDESVRNRDVFLICSCSRPVNDSLMEILIFMDAVKRASPKSINVVMTYFGYARQDRKLKGRQPISAKLVADLLTTAGLTKLIVVDLHNPSIQGFFNVPVDDLRGQFMIGKYIATHQKKFTIVSPDHGGAVRANILADLISKGTELAIIDKSRTAPNQSIIRGILGNVEGKDCLIIDDMIDTGGTILNAAKALKDRGAKKVVIAATHGLFSNGFDMFENANYVDQVIITDTIQHVNNIKSKKLVVVTLADFIASTIKSTYQGNSISGIYSKLKAEIFNNKKTKAKLRNK